MLRDRASSLSFDDIAAALETLADAGVRPRAVVEALASAAEARGFPNPSGADGGASLTSVAALCYGLQATGHGLRPGFREKLVEFVASASSGQWPLQQLRPLSRLLAALISSDRKQYRSTSVLATGSSSSPALTGLLLAILRE
ncbi:unnamed protein product, partial [Polarella glacialis]